MRGHADEKKTKGISCNKLHDGEPKRGDVDRWVDNSRYGADEERDVENERVGDRGRNMEMAGLFDAESGRLSWRGDGAQTPVKKVKG